MNSTATKPNSVKDPVCGMTVDPKLTDIVAMVEGQTFYFCAEGCRKAFIANPKKYLEPREERLVVPIHRKTGKGNGRESNEML